MASITIRKLDDEIKRRVRIAAAANGRSMEEEIRSTLRERYLQESKKGLGTYIHELFKPLGGVELEPLPREEWRPPPDFSGPEYGTYDDDPPPRKPR